MTKEEAMKLALEALENELSIDWANNEEFNSSAEQMCDAIKALKKALAKQEQGVSVGELDNVFDDILFDDMLDGNGPIGEVVGFIDGSNYVMVLIVDGCTVELNQNLYAKHNIKENT
jgi:hypothetical protein